MAVDLIIRGIDEASGPIDAVSKRIGGLEGVMNSAGSIAGGVFKAGMLGAAAGVTAIAAGLAAAISTAGTWANVLDSMGDVLGTNARDSAALAVAIRNVGGNVDAVSSQFTFLARGLETAKGKLGPTGLELQKLGINVYDLNGNLKDVPTIASNVADVFAKMPDGIEKSALMTRVMGRSGKDLSDVMNELANGGLARADEQAKALGLSLSDKDVAASKAFDRSMSILQMTLQGFAVTIGNSLMPFLERASKMLREFLVNPVIQNGAKQLAIALGLIGDGHVWSGIIHIGEAFGFTEKQMLPLAGLFTTVQGAFFRLVGAFQKGGISGVGAMLADGFQALPGMLATIGATLVPIIQGWATQLVPIIQGWAAQFGPPLTEVIQRMIGWVRSQLPAWEAAMLTFGAAVWGWVAAAIPPLVAQLRTLADALVGWVQLQLPGWEAQMLTFGAAVWGWVQAAIPPLMAQLGMLGGQLVGWVQAQLPGWEAQLLFFAAAAADWVMAAIPPLMAQLGVLVGQLGTWAGGAVESLKQMLGPMAAAATKWITDSLPMMGVALGFIVGQLLVWTMELTQNLARWFVPVAAQFLSWIWTDVVPQLPGFLQAIDLALVGFLAGLAIALAPFFADLATQFVAWISDAVGRIPTELGKLGAAIAAWNVKASADMTKAGEALGKALLDGVAAGIRAALQAVINLAAQAMEAIRNAAAGALGNPKSPAPVTIPLGMSIMQGIGAGILAGIPATVAQMAAGMGAISAGLASGLSLPVNYIAGAMPQLAAAGFSAGGAAAGRAGGDVPWAGIPATNTQQIVINATINNNMDVEDLAARVAMVSRNRGN